MELIVIRHGQSYVNLGNWDKLDTLDTALTELGHQQAKALGDWLKSQNATADALYVSTMKRAQETASYVSDALGLATTPDDRLREVGTVDHIGQPIDGVALPRHYITDKNLNPFKPIVTDIDNAESWMHFRMRIDTFLNEIYAEHPDQTVVVVAHGGVIAAMFDSIFNVGLQRTCNLETHNTSWFRAERNATDFPEWMLKEFNRVDHLIQAGVMY